MLELRLGDWFADFGTWQVGNPSCVGLVPPCGTNCAATVLCGNYASDVDSDFISPSFVVPASSPSLRFWHWFSFAGSYIGDSGSYGQVYIRAGTNAWQPLPDAKYTGQSGTWTEPYFDLTPYAGQTAQLDFYFHSAAATALGWYVDDVQISPNVQTGSLQVTANPTNGGTVAGSGSFPVGSQQPISATANAGWTFTGWNDGNTQTSRMVLVAAGTTTYIANFTQQGTNIVAANPTNGGSVTGSGNLLCGVAGPDFGDG